MNNLDIGAMNPLILHNNLDYSYLSTLNTPNTDQSSSYNCLSECKQNKNKFEHYKSYSSLIYSGDSECSSNNISSSLTNIRAQLKHGDSSPLLRSIIKNTKKTKKYDFIDYINIIPMTVKVENSNNTPISPSSLYESKLEEKTNFKIKKAKSMKNLAKSFV